MQPEDAHFEHGVLARSFDLLIDLFGDLFHRLLNAGGVDAAVRDEALEREAGDLPSDGVEARKDDDFGRIVDDEFDAGRVLDGADVAPLAADDARLHVVVGQRHDGDRRLRSAGVSSMMSSMPVAFSMARMLRPSRPMMRAFISSLGSGTTETVVSEA